MDTLLGSFMVPNVDYENFEEHPAVIEYMNSRDPTREQIARAYMIRDCTMRPDETIGHFRERVIGNCQIYIDLIVNETANMRYLEIAMQNPGMSFAATMEDARELALAQHNGVIDTYRRYINRMWNLPIPFTPYDVYMCIDLDDLVRFGW